MIYLLEDDDSIRDFVIYTMNSQGMEARGFPLPSLFWQAVGEQMPALVLLDIMLPEDAESILLRQHDIKQNQGRKCFFHPCPEFRWTFKAFCFQIHVT